MAGISCLGYAWQAVGSGGLQGQPLSGEARGYPWYQVAQTDSPQGTAEPLSRDGGGSEMTRGVSGSSVKTYLIKDGKS